MVELYKAASVDSGLGPSLNGPTKKYISQRHFINPRATAIDRTQNRDQNTENSLHYVVRKFTN